MSDTELETGELVDDPEPDNPDAEPGEDDESEGDGDDDPEATAPSEPAPLTEKQLEAREKKNDAERVRHADRIGVIYEEEATRLVECEACGFHIPGFHWPAEDYPEGSPLRGLYEMLGGASAATPVQPEFLVMCDQCNGLGFWLTGSRRDDVCRTLTCSICGGTGYRDTRQGPVTVEQVRAVQNGGAPQPDPVAALEPDIWGRPPGHRHYQMHPAYMTRDDKIADLQEGFNV